MDHGKPKSTRTRSKEAQKRRQMKKNMRKSATRKTQVASQLHTLEVENYSLMKKNVQLKNCLNEIKKNQRPKTVHLTHSSVRIESKTYVNKLLSSMPALCGSDSYKTIESCKPRGGTFGNVFPVHFLKLSGTIIVAKEINTSLSTPLEISVETKVAHLFSGHDNFPYIFGFVNPNIILMQNLGTISDNGEFLVSTVFDCLADNILSVSSWLTVSRRILSAISDMHDLQILHNDIKSNNIIIQRNQNPMIIDFGKATAIQCPSRYTLSDSQKQRYKKRYSHLAPDLIDGTCSQSIYTDIYSVGNVFRHIGKEMQIDQLVEVAGKMMRDASIDRMRLSQAQELLT